MTPDQTYTLVKLRMAETEARTHHPRMTPGRPPARRWRSLWGRHRAAPVAAAQRPHPVVGT